MKGKEIYMYAMGGVIVAGFFVLLGMLIYEAIPPTNENILSIAIGALIGFAGAVVTYFFGSSKGSADKNEMLKKP